MSRFYDIMITVWNVPTALQDAVADVVKENVDDSESVDITPNPNGQWATIEAQSTTNLCSGQSPTERHDAIADEVHCIAPNAKIRTRYHYAEWSWDEELGDGEDAPVLDVPAGTDPNRM
jgi:hypothetical protein